MNPSIAQPAPPRMMHDATPLKMSELSSGPIPVKVEPVRSSRSAIHTSPQPATNARNPIAVAPTSVHSGKALDVVLKDVAQAVKNPPASSPKFAPAPKAKSAKSHVAMPASMAIIVAFILMAAAYYSLSGSEIPQISIFG